MFELLSRACTPNSASIPESSCSVWGRGDRGQLGLGDLSGRAEPAPLPSLQGAGINSVSCGAHHSLCCSSSRAQAEEASRDRGAVWAWGCNSFGQLGLGGTVLGFGGRPPGAPVAIGLHQPSGKAHSGSNNNGNGSGDHTDDNDNGYDHDDHNNDEAPAVALAASPQRVLDLCGSGVLCMSGGDRHSVALLACDEVWAWGANDFGQLGSPLGLAFNSNEGVSSPSESPATLQTREAPPPPPPPPFMPTLTATNTLWPRPRCVEAMSGKCIVAIACGAVHTVALTDSGEVYAWGRIDAFARSNNDQAPREPSSTQPPPLAPIQLPNPTWNTEYNCCVTTPLLLHASHRGVGNFAGADGRAGGGERRGGEGGLPPPPTLSGDTVVRVWHAILYFNCSLRFFRVALSFFFLENACVPCFHKATPTPFFQVHISCSAVDTYLATRAGELLVFKGKAPLPPPFLRLPSMRAAAVAEASSSTHANHSTTAAGASPLMGAADPRSPRLNGGERSSNSSTFSSTFSSSSSAPQSLPPLPPPSLEPSTASSSAAAEHHQNREMDHDESLLSHLRHAIIDPTDDVARRALAYNIMEPREGFAAEELHANTTTARLGATVDAVGNEIEDIASDSDALAARTLALAVVALKQHAHNYRRCHPNATAKDWVRTLLFPRAGATSSTTATASGVANQADDMLPPMRAFPEESEDPFSWLDPELESQVAWESAFAVAPAAAGTATNADENTGQHCEGTTVDEKSKEREFPIPDVHASSDLLGGSAYAEIARRAAHGSAANRRRCRQRAPGLSLAGGSSSSPQMIAFLGTAPVRVRSGLKKDLMSAARAAADTATSTNGSDGAEYSTSYSVAAPSGLHSSDSCCEWTRCDVAFVPGGREGLLDVPLLDDDQDDDGDELFSGSIVENGAGAELFAGEDGSIGAELALLSVRLPGLAAFAKQEWKQEEQQRQQANADYDSSVSTVNKTCPHNSLPRVVVSGVGALVLQKLLLWATTGFITVQNISSTNDNNLRKNCHRHGRSACLHLLELAAAAQRFGSDKNGCTSSRIVWRCAHELVHNLKAWDPAAVGTVELVRQVNEYIKSH